MELSIAPSRTAKALGVIICILTFFSLIGQYSAHFLGHERLLGFVRQFDLNGEANISTYFATLFLLSASLLLGVIARRVWKKKAAYRWHWTILALIFAYLSVDEFAQIHESLNEPMRTLLDTNGMLPNAWVFPAMGLVALFIAAYARFFWHLSDRWKLLFATAGAIYVGGALGAEIVSGWVWTQQEGATFTYELIATIEEVLEMIGISLFVYALLAYLQEQNVELQISIKTDQAESPG